MAGPGAPPAPVAGGTICATTSGPRVSARVRANGLSVTLCSASPSVSVVVVVTIISSSRTDCIRRRLMSPITSRTISSSRPTVVSARQPGHLGQVPRGPAGQPGLAHEPPVAHGYQAIGGGGDPLVVGDHDERLPARVELVEQAQDVGGCGAVQVSGRLVGEDHER